jgi:hypothetical protein
MTPSPKLCALIVALACLGTAALAQMPPRTAMGQPTPGGGVRYAPTTCPVGHYMQHVCRKYVAQPQSNIQNCAEWGGYQCVPKNVGTH